MDPSLFERFDALFSLWQDGVCPGGQVVMRHKGELIYDRCFGYANIELGVPVSDDTVFHVASVSKQLTVMAVMLCVENELLQLDDDIRCYLPDLVHFPQKVTVRNMINNISGIRDIWTLEMMRGTRIDDTITQADAVKIIGNQTGLNFEPGERYMYSNSNFVLLAEIVERLTKMSMGTFLKKQVFDPLGMNSTCIRESYWQLIPNRAYSYRDMGDGFAYHPLNYGTYGATSLHTTAKDFLKWMTTFSNPRICQPETIKQMTTPPLLNNGEPSSYAGGLMVGDLEGHKYIQHSGSDASFRTHMITFPEDQLEVVIFTNTASLSPGEMC
ncbi:MAG: beta-lactamase family protein, partial [Symbiobacteriaceae bacterium]|nr:beta-lactamase family protein [Symbiobacteriaceae bacterium]